MRILTHLLILNIIICYSGICANAAYTYKTIDKKTSNCHTNHHRDEQIKQNITTPKVAPYIKNSFSECCYDTITVASDKFKYYKTTDFLSLTKAFTPTLISDKVYSPTKRRNNREHDPPVVFLFNSTFLL